MRAGEYRALLAEDFADVELGRLTDISQLRIDREQPLEKRRQQYLKRVGNPICTNLAKMLASVTCLFSAFQQNSPQNTQERHSQKED